MMAHHIILKKKMMIFFLFVGLFFMETPGTYAGMFGDIESSSNNWEELVKWAGYGEDKLSTVVITGKLFCHAHEISIPPIPVSGASMAVFCGTGGKSRKSWARGSTNSYGEFLIDLPSHLHAIPNLEKVCLVKVLNLPKSTQCRHGFTGKGKGIKLTSIGEGIRIYSTHNVHLMPRPSHVQKKRVARRENRVSTM